MTGTNTSPTMSQPTRTVRILTAGIPDVDWIDYAVSIGATIITGAKARRDCAADIDAALYPPSEDPAHGHYWKYVNGCRCASCAADYRRASARYRATGSYKAAE